MIYGIHKFLNKKIDVIDVFASSYFFIKHTFPNSYLLTALVLGGIFYYGA